jgi:arylsulfatase A-like enzyme
MTDEDFELLERLYDSELNYVDSLIGKLFEELEIRGIVDDTLAIVTSDHGENIGDHGLMAHHYSLNETLTHVPLLIRYPHSDVSNNEPNRRWSLDIPATIYDIVSDYGISSADFEAQQYGKSLLSNVKNDRAIFSEYLNPIPPIERMKVKCQNASFDVSQYDRTLRAVYQNDMKFIRGSDGSRFLYNLSTDYNESENLIESHPELATALETKLDQWIQSCGSEGGDSSVIDKRVEDQLADLGYM